MFRNQMPRYEILSQDAVAVLERGWKRIVSEVGIQFAKPEAIELFEGGLPDRRGRRGQAGPGLNSEF